MRPNERLKKGEIATRIRPVTLEVRATEGDDDAERSIGIKGNGAPYGVWTTLWDSAFSIERERFAAGCFKESLAKGDIDVMSCRDHIRADILGRQSNDTLALIESTDGLHFDVTLNPHDAQAVRIYAQCERRDIKGASCRFRVTEIESHEYRDDETKRYRYDDTILKATLYEIGPVTDPAYVTTTADVRSRSLDFVKEWENFKNSLHLTPSIH